MQVGFIGLGQMGLPIAKRVQNNKLPLRVFDLNMNAHKTFSDTASSLSDFNNCKYVFTMLPNDTSLKSVCIGKGGLIENIKKGTTVIDMSTSSVSAFKEISKAFESANVSIIDSPVSGGMI